ncbi:MAG: hypothetical protein ACTFAL_06685 [Candidatus Electronema sp. V4]|uniref:hypothetical protein n=1 Tax=Candidatus Electronema sp. V4 TaxID=3454756 RepID=UPI004055496D
MNLPVLKQAGPQEQPAESADELEDYTRCAAFFSIAMRLFSILAAPPVCLSDGKKSLTEAYFRLI